MANVSALRNIRWILLSLIVIAWFCSVKGACHHYGHSCLGAHGKKRSDAGLLDSAAIVTASEYTDEENTSDDDTMDPSFMSRSRIKWVAIPRSRQMLMMPLSTRGASRFHVILPHSQIEED